MNDPDPNAALDNLTVVVLRQAAEHERMRSSLEAIRLTAEVTSGLLAHPSFAGMPKLDRLELVAEAQGEMAKLALVGLGLLSEEEYSKGKDESITDQLVAAVTQKAGS